jgi:transcriptional regulator with XRE-family HTH domain
MLMGEAVKAIREKLGKSQQDFSSRMRVTVTTVSRWETNRVTPEPATLGVLFQMACDLRLSDAAAALASESSALFDMFGRKMIFREWERFDQIAGRLLEFRHKMKHAGATSAVPDDLWKTLAIALDLATVGKEDAKQLMAMAPQAESKP